MRESTSQRLQQIMAERNLKQIDILNLSKKFQEELGITMSKSSLSEYVSGSSTPDQYKLTLLGKTLGVSEAWLMGYNVPKIEPQNIIFGDNHGVNGFGDFSGNGNTFSFSHSSDSPKQDKHNDSMKSIDVADLKLQRSLLNKLDKQITLAEETNILLTTLLEAEAENGRKLDLILGKINEL